jgi:hypothetical protein
MAIVAKINNAGTIGRATINQPAKSTIVSTNFKPKPNVAVAELTDVVATGVQDGYTLVYNSAQNKYIASTANNITANVTITNINGGAF